MKCLQLVESAAAGVGRHVMDLTIGLLARGHQVHLLYSDLRSDWMFADELRRLKGRSGFQGFRLPMRRWPSGSDIVAIRLLRAYVGRNGPFEMIHCHSTKAGLIGRLGLSGHRVKRLYTPNMFYSMPRAQASLTKRAVGMLEAGLSRLCDRVIAVSREEYSHALELGIPCAKICLIPNGISLDQPALSPSERDAIRQRWGLGEAAICIGFVGRLAIQKSPETLVRSFATLLRRTTVPVRLVLIGDGPLKGPMRRLSTELNIDRHITWLGACDARPLMGAFDMLALTSESEGHSLVVLDAMARGLPIVATSVGGIPDTVQHGLNGFVAPVRGVQEIATALETLVNDPELRRRMGQASLVISRNFSVDRMVDQTIALYEQVVSGTPTVIAPDLKVAALR